MTEDERNVYEREIRTLRDWLIPSTLFVGICVSIVIYSLQLATPTPLSLYTGAFALLGTVLFVVNLIVIFGALGEVEMDTFASTVPEFWFYCAYTLSIVGMLSFMVSVTLMCFGKSTVLGLTSAISLTLGVVLLVYLARKGRKIQKKAQQEAAGDSGRRADAPRETPEP